MKLLYMIAESYRPHWCPKILFGLEQPQDPKEYRPAEEVEKRQFMSVWRMDSWKQFQDKYKLELTSFEQGAFGHSKVKPTTFAHNIDGIETLGGAKAPRELVDHKWKDLSLQERMAESATWAEWAPGFKAALVEALRRSFQQFDAGRCHLGALGNAEEATRDSESGSTKPAHPQAQLCPLSEVALARWKSHILNDHQPMRRDCRACVEAAGQSRPHRRVQHPSAYCLAVDLSGKLKRGKDQFGAHGAYVLVGCYTFPTTNDDVPLCGPGKAPLPEDAPLPSLEEMVEEDDVDGNVEDGELPRFESEVEEKEWEEDPKATERAKIAYDSWMKIVEHCQQVKVKTLTFAEVIASRSTSHVMEGLSKIYTKVRSLGLPVLRLHADRARELTSKAVQAWCHSRDIVTTYTCGSDWKSNGRAENEIGLVKRHAKVLMKAHNISEDLWPILVRHAAERRLRWQLQQVGYPVPDLLPFFTKVFVKRKSWNQRYAAWRWERAPGRIMGPDPWSSLTSGGYCVQLEDGKFLASTDVVVEQSQHGGDVNVDMVVQERLQLPSEQPLGEVPRRRLRYKQGVPQLAKIELGSNSGEEVKQDMDEEGSSIEEQRLLQMHKEMSAVLSEESMLIDELDMEQNPCLPSLAMLAHQKMDVELQLQAADAAKRLAAEEENFLVTKTVATDQVYREWDDWKDAMMGEYKAIVEEKKAVRQVSRAEAQRMAEEKKIKYEELPSKMVFTRKVGGRRKARACICGNYEGEVSTATYAGGCDASQIRCLVRHAALAGWSIYGTDIKCAFLNAERADRTKLVTMTVPYIYVKLGVASHQDVWIVDAAMYGLTSSPRDWSDHRDKIIPTMVWHREEGGIKWQGSFKKATDQHLWHLKEECLETGESRHRGTMAIYVDDVLLAAEDAVAVSALQSIAAVWECADAVQATFHEPVGFCGFEIQQNEAEHGGGYRLHQHSYEEELVKKWEVQHTSYQLDFKLPSPEEEAEFSKSEDAEKVRRAQACTGALLWLATRTRPELSVGVAAMSRLCTKAPDIAINIGLRMISYLKRPSRGLIYADQPGPAYGARDQLSLPRCTRTVEAFSDISYASTKGYRSLQGQVYYYAGAPVMWNTNRQPFPTQSTAESELVSLCEALVGGRATAALVAAILDIPEEELIKRLWGDNAAAIALATGEGQGSWRTRHLRIRAAILRSALRQNEWQLGHLTGRELVADSFTKIVDGAAFERALQDLCVGVEANRLRGEGGVRSDQVGARVAMLVGASLLSGAAAIEEQQSDDELSWWWIFGLILMGVGAVYVSNKAVRSGIWLYRQLLQGASGGQQCTQASGQSSSPQVRMLQCSSSEEERETRARVNLERSNYVPQVDVNDLQAMVSQSRAIQSDPYNKLHGRTVEFWQSDEEPIPSRMPKLHTSDQLPRRRKKKNKEKRVERSVEEEEVEIERAWRNLMSTTGNLHSASASSSRALRTQSGLSRAHAVSSTQHMTTQSGLSSAHAASSTKHMTTQSGSRACAVPPPSLRMSSQSGLSACATSSSSLNATTPSGTHAAAADSFTLNISSPSGPCNAADPGEAASSMRPRSGSERGAAAAERGGSGSVSHNPWNQFQMEYSGRNWGSDRMRAEYWRFKATGRKPD